jgi:hypothetical protein
MVQELHHLLWYFTRGNNVEHISGFLLQILIVAAIGATFVTNATNATNATNTVNGYKRRGYCYLVFYL